MYLSAAKTIDSRSCAIDDSDTPQARASIWLDYVCAYLGIAIGRVFDQRGSRGKGLAGQIS